MQLRSIFAVIFILTASLFSFATAPQVTGTNPVSGPTGTQVQINGSGFGASQGLSTVTFDGYAAAVISWSNTQITVKVPAQAITGQVQVTVSGVSSSQPVYFTVPPPQITSISPASGNVGTQVTVTGTGFQATKATNSNVSFNGYVGTVVSWNDTQIIATVPAPATTGAVQVLVNNIGSNQDKLFTMPNPVVTGVSPSSGAVGTAVIVTGTGFGASQGSSTLQFGGVTATPTFWSDTSITAAVPAMALSGAVVVTVGGVPAKSSIYFTVPPPQITSVTPGSGTAGTRVMVAGTGFGANQGTSTIKFNGTVASSITSWSDTQIVATVPNITSGGPVSVMVNNVVSNQDVPFRLPNPVVTSVAPSSGPIGTQVTVTGTGFGTTQGSSALNFGGWPANILTWTDTHIVATLPNTAVTGYVTVSVSNVTSPNSFSFTVSSPHITSITPSSGTPGTQVTIVGSGFRPAQTASNGSSSVLKFNGVNTTSITSWSDTQIVATVPATATTGPVTIAGFNDSSNVDVVFTTASPLITSVAPTSGPVGTPVQINGSGFGTAQGTLKFSGIAASITSWTDTQIAATVPTTATSGAVTVITGGVTSNSNIFFAVPPPHITSITPSSGPVGTQVTITGSGFQGTKGSNNSVGFPSGTLLNVVSWSDTQIVATMPSASGLMPIQVTVNNVVSNQDNAFLYPNPVISGVSPIGGAVGTQFQISGSGFGATQGSNSTVTVNGTSASIVSWSDTLITATVGAGSTTGAVNVTVGGVSGQGPQFTVSGLFVGAVSPTAVPVGAQVTVIGNGFGSSQGSLTFNGTAATTISSWTDTQIVANVPTGATTGAVKVTVSGVASNTSTIFNVGSVLVTGINPGSGLVGTQIQINGSGFGSTMGTVTIAGATASINNWTSTQILATVPSNAATGTVKVTAGGVASNTTFTYTVVKPVITGVSPSSAAAPTQFQVNGSHFGSNQGSLAMTGGNATILTWTDTQITAKVPASAVSGSVSVTANGVSSLTNPYFTVPGHVVTSITPTSGSVGTQVATTGSGFQPLTGSIRFSNFNAPVVSWSDTQIVANVPSGASTGPVRVFVNNVGSNQDVLFTMPNPTVTSLTPASGPMNTPVQITGSGFGATQSGSTVKFNGVAATPTAWTDTSITVPVPATATSGVVTVTVGGVVSTSSISFTVPQPQITSITPAGGTASTQITINDSGFHSSQGSGSVIFNPNAPATIVTWNSDTQIVATVPANATSGGVTVTQNIASNKDIGFSLTTPRITGLVPSGGPANSLVQINGSGFGATQGGSTVTFNGTAASVVNWSDTQIRAVVPAAATSGLVQVTEAGVVNKENYSFTIPSPKINSISPASGGVGTNVTINGMGFQNAPGANGSVRFNGSGNALIVSWSDMQIVATVPADGSSGGVQVTSANMNGSNKDIVFTMPIPFVSSLVPSSGATGTQVRINGSGFGAAQGSSTITFKNVAASVVSWSDTQITAVVPATATSGPVQVTEGGIQSNAGVFFNVPAPVITSVAPSAGGAGNSITITGSGFQASRGPNSYVSFNAGGTATVKSWSDTQIVAVVPGTAGTGSLNVTVNNIPSNYADYLVPGTVIASITPGSGSVGTQVTLAGTAFGSSQGTSILTFNGQPATSISSWSDTQIVASVPVTATTGPAVVAINNVYSNATQVFTVPPPSISSYTPHGGIAGTQITVSGSGFQANQRDSTLTINGTPATISSWSDTQIVATVPTTAATGPLLVTVNAVPSSSSTQFEVPNPVITGTTPPEAPANGTITINGSGFGASNLSAGSVKLNGANISYTSWSDTSITAVLPANAATGPLTVVKYNATSNGYFINVEGTPSVTGLAPSFGPVGGLVIISGSGFGPSQSTSMVFFNGSQATISSWSDTEITVLVPPGAITGPVAVAVAGVSGSTMDFTVNTTVQVTDSLGHSSSYTSAMIGGGWVTTDSTGSGCSSCSLRGTIHDDFDNLGNLTAHTDELRRSTEYTYDANFNLTSSTAHLDANMPVQTTYTYNSFGEPITVIDPLGNVTTNTYDANGNLLSVTSPAPDANTSPSVTQFAYDPKGQLTLITDPLQHHTTLDYYPTGLIKTIKDEQGNTTAYEYDLRGNRTKVTDALGAPTVFDYDLANRLTKITYVDNTFVSFTYDSRGQRTSVTDQNGNVTRYNYDDADRLTSVEDAAHNVTTYDYDTEDNLSSITDANNHTTYFSYDSFGRVTQTTFPSTLTESYIYDAAGNLTSKTDRKNQTILYVYDALNRLAHKGYPDTTGVDYVYDLVGKIKQVTDPTGTYGFAYDNMGRLIGTTTQYSFLPGITYTNSYGYDAASNRTSFTAPDGSTNIYAYDTLGRLSTLTNSLTGQFGFSYDGLGRRTGLIRQNGVNTTYSYDSLSRLLSVLHNAGTTTLDGAGYTYDNTGNRTSKTNYLNNITENYTYDPIYQLMQVTQGATTTESYSYDPVGNRLSSLGMSHYAYNLSNQLTSTPAAAYTYDNNGNTLTKTDSNGTTKYTWDFENRLTSVALPNSGGTVTFQYDPLGRRIQKSSSNGATTYLYDEQKDIEEVDGAGALLARYTQGDEFDEPLAQLRAEAAQYYEQDGLGSVTSLSDLSGSAINFYIYDAFGSLTSSIGTPINPFQYTARDYDPESSLRYYRARYYDSPVGRFLSEDPLAFNEGNNFYPYARNNPVKFRDPSGKSAGTATWPLVKPIAKPIIIICFESGVCEAVIIGAAGFSVIALLQYGAAHAPPIEADWRKRPQFQCGKRQDDKRRFDCMARYLREQAFCLQYQDTVFHSMCLARAQWRFSNCQKGIPDPGPLDPLDPNWSNY